MNDVTERIRASRLRALATVRRSIAIVRRTIQQNRALAEHPDHRESAEQRIREGADELEMLAEQEARLEAAANAPIGTPGGEEGGAQEPAAEERERRSDPPA